MKRTNQVSFIFLLFAISLPLRGIDEYCGIKNSAFLPGETITYKAYYAIANLYFAGGEAVLNIKEEELNGNGVYHIIGTGTSNTFLDHLFKVRDKYQTYMDTSTLEPYKFIRDIHEGGFKKFQSVDFIKSANTAQRSVILCKMSSLCTFFTIARVRYMDGGLSFSTGIV